MKLKSLIVLLVCLMVSAVYAGAPTVNWGGGIHDWDDTDVWVNESKTPIGKPDGTREIKMGGLVTPDGNYTPPSYGEITLNSTEEWSYIYSNRMRINGNTKLKIVSGGSLYGAGYFRVGERAVLGEARVEQSGGNITFVSGGNDPTRLVMGDSFSAAVGDTPGVYKIEGGSIQHTYGEVASSEGSIVIGDRHGTGTLQVIGIAPSIQMARLYIGGNSGLSGDRSSTGTLRFDLKAGGVSEVELSPTMTNATGTGTCSVIIDSYGTSSTANLVVTLLETLTNPTDDIVLINNMGSSAVSGSFDNVTSNAGTVAGTEGAVVVLGGNTYYLTYMYDSVSGTKGTARDGTYNDVALIPEPATIALLSIGLFAIRRKK